LLKDFEIIVTTHHSETEPKGRWVIVVASAVMLAVSMGMMVNGVSVFLIPLNEEFGWQRGSVSFINFAGLLGLAVGGIIMGRVADRTSTRRVCLLGAFVLGISIYTASYAQTLWQFYLLFFLGGFLGAGSLFTPLIANVGNWFKSGAGLAIGIASAGQALGQGAVPYGIAVLIGAMGWRDALSTMGLFTLAVLIPLALLIRQPPRQGAGHVHPGSATDEQSETPLPANTVVAWLGIAVLFCCICMSVPLMHLVPLIHDRGFSLQDAGSVMFLMMIFAIGGRVVFGKLADIIGPIRAYWIASCWQTVLVFFFVQINSLDTFYIFAAVYGFGYAGVMTGVLVCVRELTPLSRRASALGIVTLFGWLGHGIGGYQGGYFFDLHGDYTFAYANAALAGIINLVIVGALFFTIARRKAAYAM
jgi:MFS family permease